MTKTFTTMLVLALFLLSFLNHIEASSRTLLWGNDGNCDSCDLDHDCCNHDNSHDCDHHNPCDQDHDFCNHDCDHHDSCRDDCDHHDCCGGHDHDSCSGDCSYHDCCGGYDHDSCSHDRDHRDSCDSGSCDHHDSCDHGPCDYDQHHDHHVHWGDCPLGKIPWFGPWGWLKNNKTFQVNSHHIIPKVQTQALAPKTP